MKKITPVVMPNPSGRIDSMLLSPLLESISNCIEVLSQGTTERELIKARRDTICTMLHSKKELMVEYFNKRYGERNKLYDGYFSLIEKALCQKLWSPNGPEIKPIAVGMPNDNATSKPLLLNKLPYSPDIPPKPLNNVFILPALEIVIGTNRAHERSINTICMLSVITDAFMPEIWEYEKATTARMIVSSQNGMPVIRLRILLPASS